MEVIGNNVSIASRDSGAVKVVVHYPLRVLTWLIVGTAMFIWLLIGFLFWVPLLIRASIGFCVEVVNATLGNRTAEAAGIMLKRAVGFYRSGFVVALESVEGTPGADAHARQLPQVDEDEELGIDGRAFLNEVGWTVFIWYLIASALGWTTWTPVRAVTEFFAIDWAHHFGIIWYSFTSWLGSLWG